MTVKHVQWIKNYDNKINRIMADELQSKKS